MALLGFHVSFRECMFQKKAQGFRCKVYDASITLTGARSWEWECWVLVKVGYMWESLESSPYDA